jgi:hypothetical protein
MVAAQVPMGNSVPPTPNIGGPAQPPAAGNTNPPASPNRGGNAPAGESPGIPTPDFEDARSPNFGDVDTPNFGQIDSPDFGDLELPNFGDQRLPQFGDLRTPDFSDAESPDFSDLDTPDFAEGTSPASNSADRGDVISQDPTLLFTSPLESSGHLGESVAVELDLESSVLAGEEQEFGLIVDTTGNRLIVSDVAEGSLIASSGLQVGDQILAVERTWIRSYEQWIEELTQAIAGDGRAWLLVLREGERVWISLDPAIGLRPRLGVNTTLDNRIVTISNVVAGTAAAAAGLLVGDIIREANGVTITSHGKLLDSILMAARNEGRLELLVERDGTEIPIIAQVERLQISIDSGAGTNYATDLTSDEVADELSDAGLEDAAEDITSLYDLSDALLTATEDIEARAANGIRNDAREAAEIARKIHEEVREIRGRSTAATQGRVDRLVASTEQLDQILTAMAIKNVANVAEPMAAAQRAIGDLRGSLEAFEASLGTPVVPESREVP